MNNLLTGMILVIVPKMFEDDKQFRELLLHFSQTKNDVVTRRR